MHIERAARQMRLCGQKPEVHVIQATNHPMLTRFWRWYIKNSLQAHFAEVKLARPSKLPTNTPLLWHGTHGSFWDGYLGLTAAMHLRLEFRVMMLEENLKKFAFLRFAGAFGIERGSPRGALESLRYAANQLQTPTALLMFPSGEIISPHLRPIPFEAGVASLATMCAKHEDILVCPLALRLEYSNLEKPTAFLRLGDPRRVQAGNRSATLSALLQDDLERTADKLHQDLLRGNLAEYQTILRGKQSVPERWGALLQRLGIGQS